MMKPPRNSGRNCEGVCYAMNNYLFPYQASASPWNFSTLDSSM